MHCSGFYDPSKRIEHDSSFTNTFFSNKLWECFNSNNDNHDILLGSKKYLILSAVIHTSRYYNKVIYGKNKSDVLFGFDNSNFGSIIHLPSLNVQRLITWCDVLEGHDDGLQIWQKKYTV